MTFLSKSSRIVAMLVIDTVFFALELSVGIALGSLALIADAFHMLNDIISLAAGLWAVLVSQKSSTDKYSFGYLRAEILSAFFNAVFLIALCMSIILEATQRLLDPPQISNPKLILIVGAFGLASNIGGFLILGGHGHSHGGEHHHDTHDTHDHGSHFYHQKLKNDVSGVGDHDTKQDQSSIFVSLNNASAEPPTLSSKETSKKKTSVKASNIFNQEGFGIHPANLRQSIIAASNSQFSGIHDSDFERDSVNEVSLEEGTFRSEREPLIPKKKGHHHSHSVCSNKKDDHISPHERHDHEISKKPKEKGHSHTDMGMNAMILHVIGDALGNIGVIISGLVIWLTDWPGRFYADPAVSLFITLIILRSTIPLTIATAKILLQATPDHIEVDTIKHDIEALPGVTNCHHVHIWQLSDTQLVASMHIHFEFSISETGGQRYMDTARAVRKCLHAHDIHSVTIQPEFCGDSDSSESSNTSSNINVDGAVSQSRCGMDVDQCLLECVDDCQGKPCCNPKVT